MRALFTIAVLALLVLAPETHGEEPRAEVTPKRLDLPRVGTLGQAPKAGETFRVELFSDGTMKLDGSDALGLVELRQGLQRALADPRSRAADRASLRPLLIVADKDVPWGITQWVLMIAADPRVLIQQIYFAARPREGEQVGAIAFPLPRAWCPGGEPSGQPRLVVKLFSPRGGEPSDVAALFAEIRAQALAHGGAGHVHFEIRTPPPSGPSVPTGSFVQVLDVLARAGARTVTVEGAAMPLGNDVGGAQWLRRKTAEWKKRGGGVLIRLGATLLGKQGAHAPEPESQGLLPRAYGFVDPTDAVAGMEEEDLEEPLPDPAPPEGRSAGAWDDGPGGRVTGSFRTRQREESGASSDRRTRAIESALRWLGAHQSEHGGWEAAGFGRWCDGKRTDGRSDGPGKAEHDVGVTGLALLAFSGAGYTYRDEHPYGSVLKKGLRHLKEVQDAEGCFGPRSSSQYAYDHAIATLAMVEAYGMTLSPLLHQPAQRGLDFIARARNPYFAWRYGIKPGDNDTSVTAWMIAALHVARLINADAESDGRSAPFVVDQTCFDGARAWLDKMTENDFGRTGYIQRGSSPARPRSLIDRFPSDRSEAMTAAAICIRVALGESAEKSLIIQMGVKLILPTKPVWDPDGGTIDMIYWYFGALALYQVGGSAWTTWRRALDSAVIRHQRRDGNACSLRGSWDPLGPWGTDGGRVYATALMALTLQTPERYPRQP